MDLEFNKMKTNRQKLAGFTLIEMIVTIAIIATMLSVGLANVEGRSQARNLALSEQTFVSDLHKVQGFSIEAKDSQNGNKSTAWDITLNPGAIAYTLSAESGNILVPTKNVNNTQTVTNSNQFSTGIKINDNASDPNSAGIVVTDSSTGIAIQYCATALTVSFSVPYGRILQTYTAAPCTGGTSKTYYNMPYDKTTITLINQNGDLTKIVIDGVAGNIVTP
jgi:prepilin-type N-terminal cleavage/methylation domain-containing protein